MAPISFPRTNNDVSRRWKTRSLTCCPPSPLSTPRRCLLPPWLSVSLSVSRSHSHTHTIARSIIRSLARYFSLSYTHTLAPPALCLRSDSLYMRLYCLYNKHLESLSMWFYSLPMSSGPLSLPTPRKCLLPPPPFFFFFITLEPGVD